MGRKENMQPAEPVCMLADVAEVRYLHRDNTEIFLKNGFPGANIKIQQEDGTEKTEEHIRRKLA